MATWLTHLDTGATDYRLNLLGLRLLNGTCQMISRRSGEWFPIGPVWRLPLRVPVHEADLDSATALAITAFQFCNAFPDTDLAEQLREQPRPVPHFRAVNLGPFSVALLYRHMPGPPPANSEECSLALLESAQHVINSGKGRH